MSTYEPQIRIVKITAEGTVTVPNVDNSAQALHDQLGGFLEVFYSPTLTTDPMDGIIGLCDEDGLRTQPFPNFYSLALYHKAIAGTILLVRARPDGEFTSLMDDDLTRIWQALGIPLESGGWTKAV